MKLKEIRLRRGMSYRHLAKTSGVALSVIQNIEEGTGDPKISTLQKLAKALNVTVGELIGEKKTKPPKGGNNHGTNKAAR